MAKHFGGGRTERDGGEIVTVERLDRIVRFELRFGIDVERAFAPLITEFAQRQGADANETVRESGTEF